MALGHKHKEDAFATAGRVLFQLIFDSLMWSALNGKKIDFDGPSTSVYGAMGMLGLLGALLPASCIRVTFLIGLGKLGSDFSSNSVGLFGARAAALTAISSDSPVATTLAILLSLIYDRKDIAGHLAPLICLAVHLVAIAARRSPRAWLMWHPILAATLFAPIGACLYHWQQVTAGEGRLLVVVILCVMVGAMMKEDKRAHCCAWMDGLLNAQTLAPSSVKKQSDEGEQSAAVDGSRFSSLSSNAKYWVMFFGCAVLSQEWGCALAWPVAAVHILVSRFLHTLVAPLVTAAIGAAVYTSCAGLCSKAAFATCSNIPSMLTWTLSILVLGVVASTRHSASAVKEIQESQGRHEEMAHAGVTEGQSADIVGIACSGGGIRSAATCVGFLEQLYGKEGRSDFQGWLNASGTDKQPATRVNYISTVSGGGYGVSAAMYRCAKKGLKFEESLNETAVHMQRFPDYVSSAALQGSLLQLVSIIVSIPLWLAPGVLVGDVIRGFSGAHLNKTINDCLVTKHCSLIYTHSQVLPWAVAVVCIAAAILVLPLMSTRKNSVQLYREMDGTLRAIWPPLVLVVLLLFTFAAVEQLAYVFGVHLRQEALSPTSLFSVLVSASSARWLLQSGTLQKMPLLVLAMFLLVFGMLLCIWGALAFVLVSRSSELASMIILGSLLVVVLCLALQPVVGETAHHFWRFQIAGTFYEARSPASPAPHTEVKLGSSLHVVDLFGAAAATFAVCRYWMEANVWLSLLYALSGVILHTRGRVARGELQPESTPSNVIDFPLSSLIPAYKPSASAVDAPLSFTDHVPYHLICGTINNFPEKASFFMGAAYCGTRYRAKRSSAPKALSLKLDIPLSKACAISAAAVGGDWSFISSPTSFASKIIRLLAASGHFDFAALLPLPSPRHDPLGKPEQAIMLGILWAALMATLRWHRELLALMSYLEAVVVVLVIVAMVICIAVPNNRVIQASGFAGRLCNVVTHLRVLLADIAPLRLVMMAWGMDASELSECNVSDGGHFENLGVYELLQRGCTKIIAIDAEEDATSQRLSLHNLLDIGAREGLIQGAVFEQMISEGTDDLCPSISLLSFHNAYAKRVQIWYVKSCPPPRADFKLAADLQVASKLEELRYALQPLSGADQRVFPHHSTGNQMFSRRLFAAYRKLGQFNAAVFLASHGVRTKTRLLR